MRVETTYLDYIGKNKEIQNCWQRKAKEVYDEVVAELDKDIKLANDDIAYEYTALDFEFRDTDAKFPYGTIGVFVKEGNSEGYRVKVVTFELDGTYNEFMSVKTYSEREAFAISNILTRILCFS